MALCLNKRGINERIMLKLAAQPKEQIQLTDKLYFNINKYFKRWGKSAILLLLFSICE